METIKWLVTISRPRFWPYLIGPYAIGFVAGNGAQYTGGIVALVAMGVYFTFSANLLVYGINDVYDYETDKKNPKKQGYEALVTPKQHDKLATAIAVTTFPFIVPFLFMNSLALPARVSLALFLFFGVAYSAPPIRAKARPFLDTVFNSLYVFPALVSYGLLTGSWPGLELFIAAVLWCMAMHAYSAVPDIASDKKAKLQTVATVLGAKATLVFCALCYALASVLSYGALGVFSAVAGALYIGLMLASIVIPTRQHVFKLYKLFPIINLTVGFCLFWYVYIIVK